MVKVQGWEKKTRAVSHELAKALAYGEFLTTDTKQRGPFPRTEFLLLNWD
jgi:hypothetical protein